MDIENQKDPMRPTVTVSVEDLRVVLQAADYMTDRSLRGPVDRLSDAVVLATRAAAAPDALREHTVESDASRRVWCVAYDSDTPYMDGTHPTLRMAEQSLEQAEKNLGVVKARSRYAPKRNLRIETRLVTEWTTVTPPGSTADQEADA